ncbi:type VII secretion protein EssB [Lactococcus sp.]|uniref:type VII secretion protein EssB n=1 Tax=Lactococcus sp. TaxID=44273 RepID=UPI002FC81030
MKISNGKEQLEVERSQTLFKVKLLRTQFKDSALNELPETFEITEEEEAVEISYKLPENSISLNSAMHSAKSRLDKLKLAQKLSVLTSLSDRYTIPFLHPENIFLEGEELFVVHFGLKDLITPVEMSQDEFLKLYKALIFNIFHPKNSFESFVSSTQSVNDKFGQRVNEFEDLKELSSFINREVIKETTKVNQKQVAVSKGNYCFFKYFGISAIVITLVLAWFTYSYYNNNKKQNAIINAQTDFLTNNYAKTQMDLKTYSPKQLPKSARYILAVSSVNLSDLARTQKDTILNSVSTKSDDNSLNYWVYSGRGDFNQALNLAQNLGDNQLTLLAYTNLYETTKLNTSMNGAKKQELLDDYNKKIQELTKSLGK